MGILLVEHVILTSRPGHKMAKNWELVLVEGGFGAVTFCRRKDAKLGVRPMPYYEFDGDLELLQDIQKELLQRGINSTIHESEYFNSLQVHGMKNCLVLSEILSIEDDWANSLHNSFKKGKHLTEEGIKELHTAFATKKSIPYAEIWNIIENAKKNHKKKHRYPTILPDYDPLYKNIHRYRCNNCGKPATKVGFIGKFPHRDNLYYFCDEHVPNL